MNKDNRNFDANRDPLTGAPGAHPVNAQADHTNVGWLFRLLGGDRSSAEPASAYTATAACHVDYSFAFGGSNAVLVLRAAS